MYTHIEEYEDDEDIRIFKIPKNGNVNNFYIKNNYLFEIYSISLRMGNENVSKIYKDFNFSMNGDIDKKIYFNVSDFCINLPVIPVYEIKDKEFYVVVEYNDEKLNYSPENSIELYVNYVTYIDEIKYMESIKEIQSIQTFKYKYKTNEYISIQQNDECLANYIIFPIKGDYSIRVYYENNFFVINDVNNFLVINGKYNSIKINGKNVNINNIYVEGSDNKIIIISKYIKSIKV